MIDSLASQGGVFDVVRGALLPGDSHEKPFVQKVRLVFGQIRINLVRSSPKLSKLYTNIKQPNK